MIHGFQQELMYGTNFSSMLPEIHVLRIETHLTVMIVITVTITYSCIKINWYSLYFQLSIRISLTLVAITLSVDIQHQKCFV